MPVNIYIYCSSDEIQSAYFAKDHITIALPLYTAAATTPAA